MVVRLANSAQRFVQRTKKISERRRMVPFDGARSNYRNATALPAGSASHRYPLTFTLSDHEVPSRRSRSLPPRALLSRTPRRCRRFHRPCFPSFHEPARSYFTPSARAVMVLFPSSSFSPMISLRQDGVAEIEKKIRFKAR